MSQPPSPYSSPPPQGPPVGSSYAPPGAYADPRAPAKRASILMFVLGTLGLLLGGCMFAMSGMPLEQMFAQQGVAMPPLPPDYAVQLKISGGIFVLAAITEIFLGVFVRRGGIVACIGGIVLTSLILLVLCLNAAVGGAAGGPPAICMFLMMLAVFALQLFWLVQASKASSRLHSVQAAYQAQYWQYLQQQQMYQQAYNQNPYSAPPAGGQPAANQGWQWPAAPGPSAPGLTAPPPPPPPPAPPAPPLPPPPTDGGPHGQAPQ